MPELSPAAQAVMDAYQSASDGCYVNGEWIQDHAGQIAAALRAAGEQLEAAPGQSHQTPGIIAAERQLRRWAAELEGQALPQPPTQPTTDPC